MVTNNRQKDPHIDNPIEENGTTKLMRACTLGKKDKVKSLLAKGANANAKDNHGWTPLFSASLAGHAEIAQMLINAGADVNVNNGFMTPLAYADNAEVAKVLINAGAQADAKLKGLTPKQYIEGRIWSASKNSDKEHEKKFRAVLNVINQALENKRQNTKRQLSKDSHIDNPVDKDGKTLLMFACENGMTDKVKDFLAKGADPNAEARGGNTPLHYAALSENTEIAQLLINAGAKVDAQNNRGETPLHLTNTVELAKVLIKAGANVNAKDGGNSTPLHRAALTFNGDNTGLLSRLTTLTSTVERDKSELAQVLINAGADVDATTDVCHTPLHDAVHWNHLEVAKVLIENKADVNIKNKQDETPLREASMRGLTEMTQMLINAGADVHTQDRWGDTPLHLAANAKIARMLINAGADVYAKNDDGQTPLSRIEAKLSKESKRGADEDRIENLQAVINVIKQAQKVAMQTTNAQAQTNTSQTTIKLANILGKSSQKNVMKEQKNAQSISLDTSHTD